MSYYECHITVSKPTSLTSLSVLKEIGLTYGWKTSSIDGDPLLGEQIFFYFTIHSKSYDDIFSKMEALSVHLHSLEFTVLRKKIEQIVYDTKRSLM
jgi:hypothetical protein